MCLSHSCLVTLRTSFFFRPAVLIEPYLDIPGLSGQFSLNVQQTFFKAVV